MPSTVTWWSERATGQRSTAVARIPMVPVTRSMPARCASRRVASVSTWRTWPGPALLHGDRAHPGVECPGLERRGHGEAQLLAGDVVQVRLEEECTLACADRSAGSARRPMTTCVQLGRSSISPAPPPNPDDATVMSGRGPKVVARAASNAAPVGVVSSMETVAPVGRNALEQSDRRRRGVGQPAVCTAHHAGSGGDRRGAHLVDAEHLESGSGPDHVDDRVVPADLVEVDLVDRAAVQRRFDRWPT